jgi:hypothetical protein
VTPFLCESRTELCKLLKDNRPARKNGGGDRKSEEIKIREPKFEKIPTPGTRLYIEERLKRDHPKVWKDYKALHLGQFQLVYVHLVSFN